MHRETRERLNQINREFYQVTAGEFDATRQRAWAGWHRLPDLIQLPVSSLVDIACGNGRFGVFWALQQATPFDYLGIDSNRRLLEIARGRLGGYAYVSAQLCERDVVLAPLPDCHGQLIALFGILHHVPGFCARRRLLASAAARLSPGGFLVFAAWRFCEQERFLRRIVPWTGEFAVECNDYLLDWRRGERALRYCHYIDDDEHQTLIEATGLSVLDDYRADGATGQLNRYTVLRKLPAGRGGSSPHS